ncbi:MAG: hypothetical protein K2J54_05980 [Clostridia bacterium]|nr:hypothetical protein [Clostridia bacterium]
MTKKLKVYLLIVFAAACLACTLVGCKIGRPGRSELLAGYDTHVTYYSNGGYFDGSTTLRVREIYFKSENGSVPFFEITEDSKGMKVQRGSWDFAGWYEPATYPAGDAHEGEIMYEYTYTPDENDPSKPADKFDEENPDNITVKVFPVFKSDGVTPVTDSATDRPVFAREDGQGNLLDEQILERNVTIVCSDNRIASGTGIEKNINDAHGLIVCARWLPAAEIEYYLVVTDEKGNVIEGETEYTSADGKSKFKNGDKLVSYPIAGNGENPQSNEQVKVSGLTFVRTFMNEGLDQNLQFIPRPTDPDAENPRVYCRYLVGDWTVVRTAEDVRSMFGTIGASTPRKFFVINDIEYGSTTPISARVKTARAANATIVCDKPHTISGLNVSVPTPLRGLVYSMLGTVGEQFSVSGLTLKDIKITIPMSRTEFEFYAISAEVRASAANMDLNIENVTATYQGEPTIYNAMGDDRSNWLFGGAASDEAFLAQFTGVKLSGTNTLTLITQD